MGSLSDWRWHVHIAGHGTIYIHKDGDPLIEGTLTDRYSGDAITRKYDFEIDTEVDEDRPAIFRLIGGPTGYESFYMHDFAVKGMRKSGWTACAGTAQSWDRLSFSSEEMSKAFDTIEEVK